MNNKHEALLIDHLPNFEKSKLIYRASECDFDKFSFVKASHNLSNTLCFVKTERGRVYGMFTTIAWKNRLSNYVSGVGKSFVFSFQEDKILVFKHSSCSECLDGDDYYGNYVDQPEVVHDFERVFSMFGGPWAIKKSGYNKGYAHLGSNFYQIENG